MVILLAVFFVTTDTDGGNNGGFGDRGRRDEAEKRIGHLVSVYDSRRRSGHADTADGREARTRNDGKRKRKAVIEWHV